jgi:hypothetical protein
MLDFKFDEFIAEIDLFKSSARDFLDPSDSDAILGRLRSDLNLLRDRHDIPDLPAWEIPTDRPLKTKVSEGKYEPKRRSGGHYVQASISFKWKIRPNPPKKKSKQSEVFTLTGLASVRVEFHDCCRKTKVPLRALGSWRMEIGTPNIPPAARRQGQVTAPEFPGCFFHVSVLGEKDGDEVLFPKSLSVPRFPSIIFTPIAVAEFVIGELFQDECIVPARHARPDARQLASIQRKRFSALLSWQLNEVNRNHSQSPWLVLKKSPPLQSMFTT